MDGLEERVGVFIIAATNRPDIIDPAMLRPGRLDKLLYVPLPSPEDRLSILKTCVKKVPLADDVDLERIARSPQCEGYSGADLSALTREAQLCALKTVMDRNCDETSNLKITELDFDLALTKVFPSVSKKDEI